MAPEIPPQEDISISGEEDLRSVFTGVAASKLPSWTAANDDRYSNFQQFINHAIMRKVEKTHNNLIQAVNNSYLNTADEDIVWHTFRIHSSGINPKATDLFFTTTVCAEVNKYSIYNCKDIYFRSGLDESVAEKLDNGFDINVEDSHFLYKGKELELTDSAYKFAQSFKADNELAYYDRDTGYIHFLQPYSYEDLELIDTEEGLIYELSSELISHHVWNVFDEEALMHNLHRLPKESNVSLKERANDKAANPSDSTRAGLKRHIERALGIGTDNYRKAKKLGLDEKEVKIYSLSSDEYVKSLKDPDGLTPDMKDNLSIKYNPDKDRKYSLEDVAEEVNSKVNIFWNEVVWDDGYWNISDNQEFRFIPFPTDI